VQLRLLSLIISFLTERKFRISMEDEMSTPRYMQAGVPQVSVLSPTLYNSYINYTTQIHSVNLALFSDFCLYATEHKVGYVLTTFQRGLNSTAVWCERWNIKINEDKTREIYFSHRIRQPDSLLTFTCKKRKICQCNLLLENYMETTRRNDRSQGLQNNH
jgi:hypothetical protein